jgi:hypothetical protein
MFHFTVIHGLIDAFDDALEVVAMVRVFAQTDGDAEVDTVFPGIVINGLSDAMSYQFASFGGGVGQQ